MAIAAGVTAAASVASAANSIANSGGGSTSTSTTAPIDRKYIGAGQSAALNWLNSEYGPYGIPDLSGATRAGISGMQAQAPINTAFLNSAGGAASNFANGSYVGSNPAYGYLGGMAAGGATNPYLDATYNRAAGQVRDSLDSQFEGAGRYGSGMHQYDMGDALNNLATQLYGGAYDANQNRALQAGSTLGTIAQGERQQQISGIGLAPSIVSGQIGNNQALLSAGQVQDQWNQADYWRPFDALQRYMNIVNANNGTVTQTPYYRDPTSAVLGAAGLGLDAYKTFANSGSSTSPTGINYFSGPDFTGSNIPGNYPIP